MTALLKPYPAYRDTGVVWFGDVPSHWDVRRLSTLLERNDSGAWGSDHSDSGIMVLRSTEQTATGGWRIENPARRALNESELSKTILNAGDLVVTTSSGSQKHIGKTSIVTNEMETEGYGFSNFMQRLRLNDSMLPKLAWYLINNQVGREQLIYLSTTTTGLANLNGKVLGSIITTLPPLPEQRAIANFLDAMDVRITRFIAARRKMIALLEEQKHAVINRAVTKGLDPEAPMKDSGVEWLGEVPAHWEVLPLRRVTGSRCDGPFGTGLKSAHYVDQGVRVVRLQNIGFGEYKGGTSAFISKCHYSTLGDHDVIAGDLLIAGLGDENNPCGRACVAPSTLGLAMVKADCFRFRIERADLLPQFAALHLSSTALGCAAALSTGATRQRINLQNMSGRQVALPSQAEQLAIVEHVEAESAHIDGVIERSRREIALMQEYRTRLVSDVVTGKLDVRGVDVAELPEFTEIPKADEPFHPEQVVTDDNGIDDTLGTEVL